MDGEGAIAVLGATGNQGRHVAQALRAAGLPVRGLTRRPESAAARTLATLGVEVQAADMNDPESLRTAFSGTAGVFSVQNYWDMGMDAEVRFGTAVITAASASGVPHVIYSSGLGAGERRSVSAIDGKTELEHRLVASGLSYTILRPALFVDDFFGASLPFPRAVRSFASRHRALVGRIFLGILPGILGPEGAVPVTTLSQLGDAAAWAFTHQTESAGQTFELVTERLAVQHLVRLFAGAGTRAWRMPLAGFGLRLVMPDMAALLHFLAKEREGEWNLPIPPGPLSRWFETF